jgi:predicted HTH transcriptional regulator
VQSSKGPSAIYNYNTTVNDTVFALIKSEPKITAVALSEKLSIGIATVKRATKRLKENGIIARVGSDKTGYWKVVKDNKN